MCVTCFPAETSPLVVIVLTAVPPSLPPSSLGVVLPCHTANVQLRPRAPLWVDTAGLAAPRMSSLLCACCSFRCCFDLPVLGPCFRSCFDECCPDGDDGDTELNRVVNTPEQDSIDLVRVSPAAAAPGMAAEGASQMSGRRGIVAERGGGFGDESVSPRRRGVSFAPTTLAATPAAYSPRARASSVLRKAQSDEFL